MTTMRVSVSSVPYTGLKPVRSTEENLAVLQDPISPALQRATEGETYARVHTAQVAQTTAGTAMTTQLSGIEDGPAGAALKLAAANTAYRAALQTTTSIGQISLLEFLR